MSEVTAVRPRMADAIQEVFDAQFLRELAQDVKNATTGVMTDVELECSKCGTRNRKRVKAEIRDLPKLVKVVTDLLEQVEGRPGTQSVEDAGVVLVVERNWPTAA